MGNIKQVHRGCEGTSGNADEWVRVLSGYKSQLAHVDGMEELANANKIEIENPRRSKNMGDRCDEGKWKSAKAASQTNVPKKPTYYTISTHAYGVPRSSFKRRVTADRKGQTINGYDGRNKDRPFISVIESRAAAFGLYSPRYFYVHEHVLYGSSDENGLKHSDRVKQLGKDFDAKEGGGEDISRWQRLAREHDARHPHIKPELIDASEAQVCQSYRQLSQCVDGWCSARTIERWLNSHPTFEVYKKNIKPGLTEVNKVKQVNFSVRVVDHRRYLSETTKILWIMSDEKLFHALVPRYGFTLKVYTTEPI